MKKILLPIWEVVEIIIISFVSITLIYKFIAQPFIVNGASMEPTFFGGSIDKDFLVVDELVYRFRLPERKEVIVFRNPRNEAEYYIKRVIGLPGEHIIIDNGTVFVDGERITEDYLSVENRVIPGSFDFQLASDEYFVMGDNRLASSDSRIWGPLKTNEIIGVVRFRFWPFSRFALFSQES
ncbi:MAG: signal peptidase I [bacterium]